MPKDAELLISLLPAGDNVHWLYRYHTQDVSYRLTQVKGVRVKFVNMVGCDMENTIIVDRCEEHYVNNL
jgi:hypothetical protein